MAYTKQQLINEVCENRGYNEDNDGTKGEFITGVLVNVEEDRKREKARAEENLARAQAELDAIPATAKKALIQNATHSLNQKANEVANAQALSDADSIEI